MGDVKDTLTAEERAFLQRLFAESSGVDFSGRERPIVLDPAGGDPEMLV